MANVRDSDTSLWLHNKLGTSNDSWISGSICSQLNKEVLRNIKDCFPDLQTQVKLKLLLSFFHIPRRLVEEWKTELEEIIEVAGVDSELWVSMIAETIKTFPSTGSLNTEISDYEETRPIFTDMVNDLRKMVSKHSDLGMLPLECQYLNKNALISVVGQQPNPIKHFTLKRKPKSANLRSELLQKSADAQSSLKKASAPTIPLRSRGMPRKMTDTTPLKGIPSRVPTSGFRSPTSSQNQNRPNISRTPAGRKDGGIKLIEFTEQPLGYAAAKKRKRQQELEEQQKRILEAKQNAATAAAAVSAACTPATTTPDYAAGLTVSSVYTQQTVSSIKEEIKSPDEIQNNISSFKNVGNTAVVSAAGNSVSENKSQVESKDETMVKTEKEESLDQDCKMDLPQSDEPAASSVVNNARNIIATSDIDKDRNPAFGATISNSTPVIFSQATQKSLVSIPSSPTNTAKSMPLSQIPKTTNGAVVISQTIIQPVKQSRSTNHSQTIISSAPIASSQATLSQVSVGNQPQYILTSSSSSASIPALSSLTETKTQHTLVQTQPQQTSHSTKILLKTAPTIPVIMPGVSRSNTMQSNPPPLISTQQGTVLNIQNVSLPNRAVTIQPASQAAQVQHIQAQLQQQQQQQQQQQTGSAVSTTNSSTTSKIAQVVMSPGMNVKGKTIILAQKGVILRSVGGDVYQQIPLGNVSGLGNLSGTTIVTAGPPGLVKTTSSQTGTQTTVKQNTQAIPALIPSNNLSQNVSVSSLAPVVIASQRAQQSQQQSHVQTLLGNQSQQTIIRPVITANVQGGMQLPQGLTLIQRPGQQPQLVQVQTNTQTTSPQIQRTIITQNQTQIRPQQIIIQHKPQTILAAQQVQQSIQTQQQQPQRKGLSLSNEHVNKAHEMFRKANRVTRPDKALILAFMGGMRENPRPNPENVIVIKLGETEEKVKQDDDSYALMLVESLIKLDYNTGEWKTFQNYRRLDQPGQPAHQSQPNAESRITQAQNSVVI